MFSENSNSENFEEGNSQESEFEPGPPKPNTPKHISYFHTVFSSFRIGISDRKITLRASYIFQDVGIVTVEEKNSS